MQTATFQTATTEDTLALARGLAVAIRAVAPDRVLVELQGDLGAGKTVFVRGLAHAIGVAPDARVVSPTFTIARAYPIEGAPVSMLHHLDAYRLGGVEDLEAIGFEEMCGKGCLTCVEWGEYVEDALPEDRIRMQLQALPPPDLAPGEAPECPRAIEVEALGPVSATLLEAWHGAAQEALTS